MEDDVEDLSARYAEELAFQREHADWSEAALCCCCLSPGGDEEKEEQDLAPVTIALGASP